MYNQGSRTTTESMVARGIQIIVAVVLAVHLSAVLCPILGQVDTAWVREYNGPGNGEDKAVALAVDDCGNVYVTGASRGVGSLADYATIKYLPHGDTAWVRRYDGTAGGEDQATAIALDDSGNVYVTGFSWGGFSDFDYVTIKYDRNGNVLWHERYDGLAGGEDKAYAIAVDELGRVYVAGKSSGDGTSDDYATISYLHDGDTAWISRYNGTGNGPDQASALALDDSHNVYVTGFSWGGLSSLDYATVKYDSTGNQIWAKRYDGPTNGEDRAGDVAVDDSGYVYVTGFSTGTGSLRDYLTIKYYPHGDTVWARRYDGPANDRDEVRALAVDNIENVYVTGLSWNYTTNLDYATIKYLPNGDTAWIRRYNGPASAGDYAQALAVGISGDVYVTGISQGNGTGQDYATLGYYPNGDTAWIRRYCGDSGYDDEATAVAVDSWGNVYVTGCNDGSSMLADYATVKYAEAHDIPGVSRPGLFILAVLLILIAASMIDGRKLTLQKHGEKT